MDRDVAKSLVLAAEALLGRSLQSSEKSELENRFDSTYGSHTERSLKTLQWATSLTPTEIEERTNASDNINRVMHDLRNALRKAGSS